MANTTKGFPYPAGSDAVDVAGDIQALAEAVDETPGVQSYTSTEIAGLAVGAKWAGRVVWNSTAGKLQVSNGSTFSDVDTSVALSSSTPQTLGTAAAGTSSDASRADHRHAMPSASDVGAIGISLFANKGTIAAASAASTPAALSVGSNGQMLMADSSATAGLRYVDPPANRRLTINGDMQVHQRGTSVTGITTTGYYTADRWRHDVTTMGTWTNTTEADAPSGTGLTRSLKILCTTADSSPASTDAVQVVTRLEGQDLQRIAAGSASAQQLTLSFWVKSNVTGTYVAEINTGDGRFITRTYSVSASATWERKTITYPANTVGTLANDNSAQLMLRFWLGSGSAYTSGSVLSDWAVLSSNLTSLAPGQVNLAAATNNYWQVTGVQLETGPVATPFEFEPYEATLRKCQRYYYRQSPGTTGYPPYRALGAATATTEARAGVILPVPMRAKPTSIEYANIHVSYFVTGVTATAITLADSSNTTNDVAWLTVTVASGLTARDPIVLMGDNNANTYLAVSAEL